MYISKYKMYKMYKKYVCKLHSIESYAFSLVLVVNVLLHFSSQVQVILLCTMSNVIQSVHCSSFYSRGETKISLSFSPDNRSFIMCNE